MDRIGGVSMMDQIKRRPFLIRKKVVMLAVVHLGVLKVHAASLLTAGEEQAKHCINTSNCLTDHVKGAVLGVLDHLPTGNFLCHGGFHPGNIFHSDGSDY